MEDGRAAQRSYSHADKKCDASIESALLQEFHHADADQRAERNQSDKSQPKRPY